MRTTLEIDDDVMLAATELARLRNENIDAVISGLARRGLVSHGAICRQQQNAAMVAAFICRQV